MRDLFSRFLSRFESLNRSLIKYIKRVYNKSGIYGMSIGSLVFFLHLPQRKLHSSILDDKSCIFHRVILFRFMF